LCPARQNVLREDDLVLGNGCRSPPSYINGVVAVPLNCLLLLASHASVMGKFKANPAVLFFQTTHHYALFVRDTERTFTLDFCPLRAS